MIFLLYVDHLNLHVRSYLSTCISLLPCRCLSFLPHDIAPISVVYLLCCPTSSFETLSLSPSCPAPPWKWCHSSHEKGDNGHNGPPLPEVPGSQTMWGKVWSKLRKDLHPCLQNRVSCLLVKKVTWKHTLACWLAFLASHKEAPRIFHKSLQNVKYEQLN